MVDYIALEDGRLMEQIERCDNPAELKEMKKAGVFHGNYIAVLRAASRIGETITRKEFEETLIHAVGKYGWSFDDARTLIGSLYQLLHGKDFLNKYGPVYVTLSREEKNILNRKMWENNHGGYGTFS